MITPQILQPEIVNSDIQTLDSIKLEKSNKSQLKKVTQEFEAVFVTQMITLMDKTIDREGGLFGEENKYMDNFKSLMFNEMGRQIAKNPHSSFGFAQQMYSQMERALPPDKTEAANQYAKQNSDVSKEKK